MIIEAQIKRITESAARMNTYLDAGDLRGLMEEATFAAQVAVAIHNAALIAGQHQLSLMAQSQWKAEGK